MAADKDGGMTFFDSLFASPVGGDDDNSVDIYDGLDSLPSANTSKQCTPSRDLDLYEELLTEEGTAKESSYKNLHEEFDKSQRQLKELLQKLNDLQTQNSGLQTENQCLKKNISALIKTARVEISRKDDEISRLSQRMLGVPSLRSNYNRNPVPSSAGTSSPDVSKARSTNGSLKTDQRQKESLTKEVTNTSSPQNTDKDRTSDRDKESTLLRSKNSHEKLCSDRVRARSSLDNCSDEDSKRGRKETRTVEHGKSRTSGHEKESPLHISKVPNEKPSSDRVRSRLAKDNCSDEDSKKGRKETRTVDHSKIRTLDHEKDSVLHISKVSNEKRTSDSVRSRLALDHCSDEDSKRGRKETRTVDHSKGRTSDHEKESTLHISKASHEKPSSDSVRSLMASDNCSEEDIKRGRKETRTVDHSKGRTSDHEKESTLHRSKTSHEKLSSDSVHSRLALSKSSGEDSKRGKKETKPVDSSRESVDKNKIFENKCAKKHTSSETKNADCQLKEPAHGDKASQSLQNHEMNNLNPNRSSDTDDQTDLRSFTRGRPPTIKKKSPAKEELQEERLAKRNEKSPNINKKEIPEHGKEVKKSEHKNKPSEKEPEEPRRSSRVNSLHSKSDFKSCDRLSKGLSNDSNSGKGAEYQRDNSLVKCSSRDGRSNSSSSRQSSPKETGGKRERGDKKSERHRSKDKNKKQKESPEGTRHSRNEKKETNEHLKKSRQEAKQPIDKEKNKSEKSAESEMLNVAQCSPRKIVCKTVDSHENEKNMCLDPKLSFMEKLNLTLSPAKRKSLAEIEELQAVLVKAREEGATRAIKLAKKLALAKSNITEESIEATVQPLSITETSLAGEVPEQTGTIRSNSLEETASQVLECETATDSAESLPLAAESADVIRTDFQLLTVINEGTSSNTAVDDDSQTVSSEELETRSIVEEAKGIQLDSIIETDSWNVCADGESLDNSSEGNAILKNICEAETLKSQQPIEDVGKTCSFKPISTESERCTVTLSNQCQIDIRTSSETKPDIEDDSSVMSVDLNCLRNIPQALSPLTSPMKPVVKMCRMASPAMASVMRNLSKDLSIDRPVAPLNSKGLSSETNKENQNPVGRPEKCPEAETRLELSEELEEGEILSDDDTEKLSQESSFTESDRTPRRKKSKRKASPDQHTSHKYQQNQKKKKKKKTHSGENSPKITTPDGSAPETRAKAARESSASSKETESDKETNSPGPEEIEKIAEPSTVQEIMQMLRAIRDHIRKKYMKFKVQFSLRQFHGIIEAARSKLTLLLNSVDWSRVCSSPDCLRRKLCKTIESRLKQVKKNGIVDRIFGQHVLDMKKKLWKFVDDQLHYLFEKVKGVLVKLCDLAREESECDGASPITETKGKVTPVADLQKPSKMCQKTKSHKSKRTPSPRAKIRDVQSDICQRVISIDRNAKRQEKTKTAKEKRTFLEKLEESATSVCNSEGENSPRSLRKQPNELLQKEQDVKSQKYACKSDLCNKLLMEQQTSSLTFNLVSDAHMGEIFKSLLDNPNLPEDNLDSLEKSYLECGISTKAATGAVQCDSVCNSFAAETIRGESFLPSETDCSSSPVAPSEKSLSISSMLPMPVNPDILDESCMLEVPTFSFPSKDNTSCEEKDKSYISILMEDLAVSSTVPSPLKSDCHLSFLRHEGLSTSTPEEVINAHYSEDALLEEEDATEQDIHLALESDNSSSQSSCSSSWANQNTQPGFQYHPKQPMKAEIMEKSNDHFVVKIRRAVLTALPNSDQTSLTDAEYMTSLIWNENTEAKAAEENVVSLNSAGIQMGDNRSHKYLSKKNTADELMFQERACFPPELNGQPCVISKIARRAPYPTELDTQAPTTLELTGSATTPSELVDVTTPSELVVVPVFHEQAGPALPQPEQTCSDYDIEPTKTGSFPHDSIRTISAPREPVGPVPNPPEPTGLTPESFGPDQANCLLAPPESPRPAPPPLPLPELHGPCRGQSSLTPPETSGPCMFQSSPAPPLPPEPAPPLPPEPPGPYMVESSPAPPLPPGPSPPLSPEPPGPCLVKSNSPPEPPALALAFAEKTGQCLVQSFHAAAGTVPSHPEPTGACLSISSPSPSDLPLPASAPSYPPGRVPDPPEPPEPRLTQSTRVPFKTCVQDPAHLDPPVLYHTQSSSASPGLCPAQSLPTPLVLTAPYPPVPSGLVCAPPEPSGLAPQPPESTELARMSHETSGESSEMDSSGSDNRTENSSELLYVQELEAPEEVVETFNNSAEFFSTSPDNTSNGCAEVTFVDLTEETDDESKNEIGSNAISASETLSLESRTASCDNVGRKRKKETGVDNSCKKKIKHNLELVIETKRQRRKTRKAEESEFFTRKRSSSKKATPEKLVPQLGDKTGPQVESVSVSPHSLSAKNVIKKKGEVVVSWTRDEDREILLECQKEGPSEEAFVTLALKLKKDIEQVQERFYLLMKLFKKSTNTSS